MKIVGYKNSYKIILIIILFVALFLISLTFQSKLTLNYSSERENDHGNNKELFFPQTAINDTSPPIITFVQPYNNNTIIRQKSYTIIANISDDNPPSYGNVSIQFSNYTNFLFNAIMNYDIGNQWSFVWDNISLYPNQPYIGYIIQIRAKDSSSNENLGWSENFYLYLNVAGKSPGILQMILYLLVVSFIIAAIVVFMNKKLLRKLVREKE